MKNKWLIVLFVFFLGVIFLSLLITRQSQKAVSLLEQEISITAQAENSVLPNYLPQQSRLAPGTRLPLVRSKITITPQPATASAIESAEKRLRATKSADQTVKNVSSMDIAASSAAEVEVSPPQTGVTKTGKRPTPQEAQEMNSSGVVMY